MNSRTSLSRSRHGTRAARLLALAASLHLGSCSPRASLDDPATAALETKVRAEPDNVAAWNRLADARLSLLASSGDLALLTRAAQAVERSLRLAPPECNRGALAMRARVEMASHRFPAARRSAEQLRALLPDVTYPLGAVGDALFALGEYAGAERVWRELATREGSSLSTEPRLAQLDLVFGRNEAARQRMAAALTRAEQETPAIPGAAAGCHLRLGELAFRSGDWEEAEAHYDAAERLQPGDFGVREHIAELRGAQGKTAEAVALYTALIARTGRPELMQALGDLHAFARDDAAAKVWFDRADAAYRESVARGEVLYFHHLAGFHTDSRPEPRKAVEWARKDIAMRGGIQAHDALAWALYKAGDLPGAREAIACAIATGTRDAHILFHAGMIHMSAGDLPGGRAALAAAAEANPRFQAFHVHR